MAKSQVLSPIASNIPKQKHTRKASGASSTTTRHMETSAIMQHLTFQRTSSHRDVLRRRSPSVSSLSSLDEDDNDEQVRRRKALLQSPASTVAATPRARSAQQQQQQQQPRARQSLVDMFSPVRAMRVARAGIKRKRGGAVMHMHSTRGRSLGFRRSTAAQEASSSSSSSRQRGEVTPAPVSTDDMMHNTDNSNSRQDEFPLRTAPSNDLQSPFDSTLAVRPRPQQKRNESNASLRRNLGRLHLDDEAEQQQHQHRIASPASLRSMDSSPLATRRSSRHEIMMASRKASGSSTYTTGTKRSRSRSRRQSYSNTLDESSDANEEEQLRLLRHAPTWQLRKLTKGELFDLHVRLGSFEPSQISQTELLSKQSLVEGIIQRRSHQGPTNSTGSAAYESHSRLASGASSRRQSSSAITSIADSAFSPTASLRRSDTQSSVLSRSSEYTDEDDDADYGKGGKAYSYETDANDAAGEETEVEPVKASARRKSIAQNRQRFGQARSSFLNAQGAVPFPMRKDPSNDGTTSRSSASVMSQQPRRRLRHRASLHFAASSPVRTRARTRNQSAASQTTLRKGQASTMFQQRLLRANLNGDIVLGDVATPTAVAKNGQQNRFGSNLSRESEADDDDWQDASPTFMRQRSVRTPRKAKLRAQKQLIRSSVQVSAEDSEAMVENVLDGPREVGQGQDSDDAMSVDLNAQALSEMSMDETIQARDFAREEQDASNESEEDADDQAEHDTPSDFDVNASPSKVRKLRNGKIRMPTGLAIAANPASEAMGKVEEETVPLQEIHPAVLNRMKRDQLIDLCEVEGVEIAENATRAILIDALLEKNGCGSEAPSSNRTGLASSASARTARPGSTSTSGVSLSSRTTGTNSEKPLLLRSSPLKSQSHEKPGHPTHLPTNEEELNGLDLESLQLVDKEIPYSKLEKLEKIGSGGFKDVYVGKYQISKKSTKKVAIADIRDQLSEMDIKELTLLRDLKHENIVRFIGVCIPPLDLRLTPCMIVSELCANGDLYDYIRNVEPPPDEEIFRIMLETARGLEYLHLRTPAIIHRDCKSTNVLITRNRTAKINDFGLARVRNSKRSMIKSLVGTVNWQAVELWVPKPKYDEKVDVWSAGMTFWETLQWHLPEKKYPFQDMNEHQIYQDVGQKKLRPPTISIRRRYGTEIVDLIDRMWSQNPRDRPTMSQVCEEMQELVAMKREQAAAEAQLGGGIMESRTKKRTLSNGNGITANGGSTSLNGMTTRKAS